MKESASLEQQAINGDPISSPSTLFPKVSSQGPVPAPSTRYSFFCTRNLIKNVKINVTKNNIAWRLITQTKLDICDFCSEEVDEEYERRADQTIVPADIDLPPWMINHLINH